MNWKLLFAIVVTAALIGALRWREHGEAQRLQTELAAAKAQVTELEKLRAELDRLSAANERMRAEAIDPIELARLRALGNDVRQLQGEKAELEKKLVAAEAARAQMARESTASASTNEPPKFKLLSNGRATVSAGQTIISGGWVTSDGKRALAFITATEEIDAKGNSQVSFEVRLVGVPPESFKNSGLEWFLDGLPADQGTLRGVVDSKALQVLQESLSRDGQLEILGGGSMGLPLGFDPELKPGVLSGKYLYEFYNLQRASDGRALVLDFSVSEMLTAATP